jgi:hypothetical protein
MYGTGPGGCQVLETDGTSNSIHFGSICAGSINLKTCGTTRMFLSGGGTRVGIGTTNPLGTAHIYTADAGAAICTNGSHDDLIIENNGNAGIQISGPTSSYQYLAFGDIGSANQGYVRYYHDADRMDLRAGGYDTISIVGGCAGIGTTTPGEKLTVQGNISAHGALSATDSLACSYFAGDVGIGTTAPGAALDVAGTIRMQDSLRANNGSNKLILYANSDKTELHAAGTTGTIFKNNGNVERARLTTDGKLGINEDSIDAYLHLSNSTVINQKFERPQKIIPRRN